MIKVIGIGNDCRADDYVGLYVVGKLKDAITPGLELQLIQVNNSDASDLLDLWEPEDEIYIVDAIQAQGQPGECLQLDLNQSLPAQDMPHASSHTFNIKEAVELTKLLKKPPKVWQFFGIIGEDFSFAEKQLSPRVQQSADALITTLLNTLNAAKE